MVQFEFCLSPNGLIMGCKNRTDVPQDAYKFELEWSYLKSRENRDGIKNNAMIIIIGQRLHQNWTKIISYVTIPTGHIWRNLSHLRVRLDISESEAVTTNRNTSVLDSFRNSIQPPAWYTHEITAGRKCSMTVIGQYIPYIGKFSRYKIFKDPSFSMLSTYYHTKFFK